MTNWRALGSCVDVDPDVMFPAWNTEAIAAAKRVCAGCGVRAECLSEAVRRGETDGVWGGLTPTERERFVDEVYRTPTVPCPGCGRERALTAEGVIRVHKTRHGYGCWGSGVKP